MFLRSPICGGIQGIRVGKLNLPLKLMSRPSRFVFTLAFALLPLVASAQDRQVPMNIVFPPAAFSENGGPVIDITKPPYNAKGDGQTDDTAAFVAAFEHIQDLNEAKKPPVQVYVPNGTYLVSDTLARRTRVKVGADYNYRLIGQDRTKTIIRLKDNAPGFGEGAEKPVITCNPSNSGNGGMMWGHQLRNLTVDTGRGNPGAIGVIWRGANATVIENLTIRSGDGAGAIGLDFREWCVQGHFCDLTIEGFQIGIRTRQPAETNPVIEYVTLKGQRQAAVVVDRSTPCLRRVESRNAVPAVRIIGEGSQCVIVDSTFTGGDPANAAIELVDSKTSQLFVRDTKVSGYGTSILVDGASVAQGDITEWLSGKVFSFDPKAKPQTLRLPIQEAVLVPWESDPANWANPDDFEGADDVAKIQAALNSGKPAVLFPRTFILPKGATLNVPATVRQIEFFNFDHKMQGGFRVTEPSTTPLWINNPGDRVRFTVAAKRDIHARNGTFSSRVETKEPVVVHAQAICRYEGGWFDEFCPPNVTFFGRSINEENWHDEPTPNWTVNGGTMWVLGFKTEGQNPAFHVKNNGRLEVLGGYVNFAGKNQRQNPDLINEDSEVTYIGTNFMSRTHWLGIEEVRDGFAKRFENKDFPRRKSGQPNNYFVPLYVGRPGTKFEFSRIALPQGTEIKANFTTDDGKGPDKLFDGNSGTWMVGGGGSYRADTASVITLQFPAPIDRLGAIRTGKSDKFHNYYPVRMEFWADTKGNGEFDSKIGAAEALGPDTKSEGIHPLPQPVSGIHALQIRVPEQHTAGGGRVWTMDEISLLRANE